MAGKFKEFLFAGEDGKNFADNVGDFFKKKVDEGVSRMRPDEETKKLQEEFNNSRKAQADAEKERLATTKTVVTEKISPEEAAKKTPEDLDKNDKILGVESKRTPKEPVQSKPVSKTEEPANSKSYEDEQDELAYNRSVYGDENMKDEGAMTDKQKLINDIYKKYEADYNVKPLTPEQKKEELAKFGIKQPKDLTEYEKLMIESGFAELGPDGTLSPKKYSPGIKYILGNVGTVLTIGLSLLTGGLVPPLPVNKIMGQDKAEEKASKLYDQMWDSYIKAKAKEEEGKGAGAGEQQRQRQIAEIPDQDAIATGQNEYKSSREYARDMQTYTNDIYKMIEANTLQKDLAAYMQKLDVNKIPALVDAWEGSGRDINTLIKYVQAEKGNFTPEWKQKFDVYNSTAKGIGETVGTYTEAVGNLRGKK